MCVAPHAELFPWEVNAGNGTRHALMETLAVNAAFVLGNPRPKSHV